MFSGGHLENALAIFEYDIEDKAKICAPSRFSNGLMERIAIEFGLASSPDDPRRPDRAYT